MTNLTLDEARKKCSEKVKNLEERAKRLEKVLGTNETTREIPDWLLTVMLNNERMGIGAFQFLTGCETIDEGKQYVLWGYTIYSKKGIIYELAERGDPLAIKVKNAYEEGKMDDIRVNLVNNWVHRKMSERDYFGYLNGGFSISTIDKKDVYLSEDSDEFATTGVKK